MKTKLILGSLLVLTYFGNAQTVWNGSNTTGNAYRTGNIGLGDGNVTSPIFSIDMKTSVQEDGMRIQQTGTGQCGVHLNAETSGGGHKWSLYSNGSTSSNGGTGNFSINDNTSLFVPRFVIEGSSGNIGIGTITPSDAKLQVTRDITPPGQGVTFWGTKSNIQNTSAIPVGGGVHTIIGVEGIGTGYSTNAEGVIIGMRGQGKNGNLNYGGYFQASGGNGISVNTGIQAVSDQSGTSVNYGIWAEASGASTNYAGYFLGNVIRTGTDNFTSDQKLKNNIKSMANVLDKIKLLNPCTYTFKTDDQFKKMNLPGGMQMGLIAQELEKIFPELVNNNPAQIRTDEKGQKKEIVPEFKSVQYISLIPVLIAGIQEQQKQIEDLKQTISDLSSTNNAKTLSPTGIDGIQGANGFMMEQNIPNPFSSETLIKYTLTSQTKIASLIVYDLSGKQINSFPLEIGSSSITINSDKLAAGIYIYSIMADGKIMDSKRMVVAQK